MGEAIERSTSSLNHFNGYIYEQYENKLANES